MSCYCTLCDLMYSAAEDFYSTNHALDTVLFYRKPILHMSIHHIRRPKLKYIVQSVIECDPGRLRVRTFEIVYLNHLNFSIKFTSGFTAACTSAVTAARNTE